jgi:hypothetical protein
LTNLRSDVLTVPIWIDQICIDQSSHRERTHNVRQMAEIYRSATAAIIWTSECDPELLSFFNRVTSLPIPIKEFYSYDSSNGFDELAERDRKESFVDYKGGDRDADCK